MRKDKSNKGHIVDVLCSVYNPKPTLLETVNSVLDQTFSDFRFVLIDDGTTSRDGLALIEHVSGLDSRVTLVTQSVNVGLTQNLYEQVEKSNARYIARIDAGDVWLPDKLKKQILFMERNPDVVVLGTQCLYLSKDRDVVGRSWFAECHDDILEFVHGRRGVFEHSSIVFRHFINYRPEFKMAQDLDLYLRAIMLGNLHCLGDVLTHCEMNMDGLTVQNRYLQRKYQNLAYKSYYSVLNGVDFPLVVKENTWEKKLWKCAQPFYKKYIAARTKREPAVLWFFYLSVSMLFYPPLISDYLRKALFLKKERFKCK